MAIKVAVVAVVIVVGIGFIDVANYSPFVPESKPAGGRRRVRQTPLIDAARASSPAVYGSGGVVTGAAVVFFAFIGFDVVATTAEETRNPQRDVPIGILGRWRSCTVLYGAVSLVITGMQNYTGSTRRTPRRWRRRSTPWGSSGWAT